MKTTIDVDATLRKLKTQVAILLKEREDIDVQLENIRQSIAGLLQFRRATLGASPEWEAWSSSTFGRLGLTDACRNVLKAEPRREFRPVEVKERLGASGFDFSEYKSNPLSAIHTVLKRLLDNKEAWAIMNEKTQEVTGYKWRPLGTESTRTRRKRARGKSVEDTAGK
jgi:hypothetical protein